MKIKLFSIVFLIVFSLQSNFGFSQGVAVKNTSAIPNSFSILDIDDDGNDKGILIPRITTLQREAIAGLGATEEGLTVYDETTNSYWLWDGSAWQQFAMGELTGSGAANHITYWSDANTVAHDQLVWDAANNRIGIGVASPNYTFDLNHTFTSADIAMQSIAHGNGCATVGILGQAHCDGLTGNQNMMAGVMGFCELGNWQSQGVIGVHSDDVTADWQNYQFDIYNASGHTAGITGFYEGDSWSQNAAGAFHNNASGTATAHGIYVENISTTATRRGIGIDLNTATTNEQCGIYSHIYDGSGTNYGMQTRITATGSSTSYGTYTTITGGTSHIGHHTVINETGKGHEFILNDGGTGIDLDMNATSNNSYGIDMNISGSGHTYSCGINGEVGQSSPTNGSTNGIFMRAWGGTSSGITRGVYGRADDGYDCYGVRGEVIDGSNNKYGVSGYANASTGTTTYGVYGEVSGSSGDRYAIYGDVRNSGADAYAGYFNSQVYVQNTTIIGKTATQNASLLFTNAGTQSGYLRQNANEEIEIRNEVSDADMRFFINDGGTNTEMLRFDADASSFITNGGMELFGLGSGDRNAYIDFRASTAADYDFRLIRSPGTNGEVHFQNAGAGSHKFYIAGFLRYIMDDISFNPGGDNAYDLGTSSLRWNDVYATNGTIQTSDKRMKTDINNLEYGLDEVLQLSPVAFYWKSDKERSRHKIGFIAQDVQLIMPELVNVGDDENHLLGINYGEFAPVIVKSIQEQNSIIEEQAQIIETLQTEIEHLKIQVNKIDALQQELNRE